MTKDYKQWNWTNYSSLELQEYHKQNVKQKNPDTKGDIVYDFTLHKVQVQAKQNYSV